MNNNVDRVGLAADGIALGFGFQDILNSIEDELLVIDTDYKLRFANNAVLKKFGHSPVGKFCYEVLREKEKPCTTPLSECPLKRVLQTGRTSTLILPDRHHGIDIYLKITAYPLRDADGNIKAILQFRRDITSEKELEPFLLKQSQQLLALKRISKALSVSRDLDTVLSIALDNVLDIIDGTIGGILLLDKRNDTLYYRVQRGLSVRNERWLRIPKGKGISGKVAQTGTPIRLDDISNDPDALQADLIDAEGIHGFVSIPLQAMSGVVGVLNVASRMPARFAYDDVSLLVSISGYLGTTIEQVALHDELERAGEKYQALLRYALNAQEEERKRIARELHDETSQTLTSLTLNLKALIGMAEMAGIENPAFTERLKTAHANAVHAGTEIVKLMKELRPTLLDELGMSAAIHRYAKDTLETNGVNVTTEFVGTDQRFPPQVELTLFRVTQGLIGNILKHSGAKNVSIKLECDSALCTLRVKDDGKGFNPNQVTRIDPSGRGAGLLTMKERVEWAGGSCHIDSAPGHGTDMEVKIPLAKKTDEKDQSINS